MAEPFPTLPLFTSQETRRHRTHRLRSEAIISRSWPRGVAGLLDDYRRYKTSSIEIYRITGIQFRALRRLCKHYGVPMQGKSKARTLWAASHPEWCQMMSVQRTKNNPTSRPEVRRKMSQSKIAAYLANHENHPNSRMPMTVRETEISVMLTARNIDYVFNQHASIFWLDFYLPAFQVGIELQSHGRPRLERDTAIREALNLRTILYFPCEWLRKGWGVIFENFLDFLKQGSIPFEQLHHSTQLTRRTKACDVRIDQFNFICPFAKSTKEISLSLGQTAPVLQSSHSLAG